MNRYGLIGGDTKASLSPKIHEIISLESGIKYSYDLISINKFGFSDIKEMLKKENLSGINITNPYKTRITGYIDVKNGLLKNINSANCIRAENNGMISGTNTDGPGFMGMLYNNKIDVDKDFAILGSGGAAISIAYTLAKNHVSSLSIICRNYDKGKHIKFLINRDFPDVDIYVNNSPKYNNMIIVNCTPVVPIPSSLTGSISSEKISAIIDINYSMRSNYPGVKSIDGIDMLIYQAIFSVNYWFRTTIDRDIDIRRIKNHINNA